MVVDYLTLRQTISKYDIIATYQRIMLKKFQHTVPFYKVHYWTNQYLDNHKETLLFVVKENKILAQCSYGFVNKGLKYRYTKHAKTTKVIMLSNLASLEKGNGKKLVNHILKIGELNQADVMLYVQKQSLVKYYEQFGFIHPSRYSRYMVKHYKH